MGYFGSKATSGLCQALIALMPPHSVYIESHLGGALAMVFKLLLSAQRKWRRLDGSKHLAEVIQGVIFKDGIKQIQHAA